LLLEAARYDIGHLRLARVKTLLERGKMLSMKHSISTS
jgi:hypothetical protein